MFYRDIAVGRAYWSRFTSGLAAPEEPLFSDADQPGEYVLGASTASYGLAWVDAAAGSRFRELGSDGQVICGPLELPAPDSGTEFNSVVPMGAGWLIGGQDRYLAPRIYPMVQLVRSPCRSASAPLYFSESSYLYTYGPYLASGPRGVAAVWSAAGMGVYLHVLGPQLCDAPR